MDAVLKQEESLSRVVTESYVEAKAATANEDAKRKEFQGKVRIAHVCEHVQANMSPAIQHDRLLFFISRYSL